MVGSKDGRQDSSVESRGPIILRYRQEIYFSPPATHHSSPICPIATNLTARYLPLEPFLEALAQLSMRANCHVSANVAAARLGPVFHSKCLRPGLHVAAH